MSFKHTDTPLAAKVFMNTLYGKSESGSQLFLYMYNYDTTSSSYNLKDDSFYIGENIKAPNTTACGIIIPSRESGLAFIKYILAHLDIDYHHCGTMTLKEVFNDALFNYKGMVSLESPAQDIGGVNNQWIWY